MHGAEEEERRVLAEAAPRGEPQQARVAGYRPRQRPIQRGGRELRSVREALRQGREGWGLVGAHDTSCPRAAALSRRYYRP